MNYRDYGIIVLALRNAVESHSITDPQYHSARKALEYAVEAQKELHSIENTPTRGMISERERNDIMNFLDQFHTEEESLRVR